MLKYSSLPLLINLLLCLPTTAAGDTGRLNLANADSNEITLYTNKALVTQTFIELPDKKGKLVLEGFDSNWQESAFLLQYTSANKRYFPERIWWHNDTLNRDSLYAKLVGHSVELAGATINEPVQGKLLAYNTGVGLVQGNDKRQYIVDLNDAQGIRLTFDEAIFKQQDYTNLITAEFGEQNPQGALTLTYISPLLHYTSLYRLTREDKNQSRLERLLTLKNTSDIDYQNATISLVAGDINESPRLKLERSQLAAMSNGQPGPVDQRVGELLVTPLNNTWSLQAHTSAQITQFKQENIKFDEHYLLEVYGGAYRNGPATLENPRLVLHFEAKADLAAGQVEVFEQNKDGTNLQSGNAQLAATIKGDQARLLLGKALTVRVDREKTTSQQSGNELQIAWKTTVHNDRQSPITFILDDRQHNLIQITNVQGGSLKGNSRIEVKVPAKGKKIIRYRTAYGR